MQQLEHILGVLSLLLCFCLHGCDTMPIQIPNEGTLDSDSLRTFSDAMTSADSGIHPNVDLTTGFRDASSLGDGRLRDGLTSLDGVPILGDGLRSDGLRADGMKGDGKELDGKAGPGDVLLDKKHAGD